MLSINTADCINCGACIRSCPVGVFRSGDPVPSVADETQCFFCMHCTAACPAQAIHFSHLTPEREYPPMPEDPLEKLILSRRAVRHFQEIPPDRALIQWALDAAAYAPSGKNIHANRWSVIYGQQATDLLTEMALTYFEAQGKNEWLRKLYKKGKNLMTCGAPCVIVGWSPRKTLNPCVDTVIAMETVELLLYSRGVSSCWGGYLNEAINSSDIIRNMLSIPDDCSAQCALMTGFSDGETYVNVPFRPKAKPIWVD